MTDPRYQGDPKIFMKGEDARMLFIGGQPVMSTKHHNAVAISLFTKKGWAGNAFMSNADHRVGSDFLKTTEQEITISSVNDIALQAELALKWMIKKNIYSKIEADFSNPSSQDLNGLIECTKSGSEELIRYYLARRGNAWWFEVDGE